jgi:hypothetical protein
MVTMVFIEMPLFQKYVVFSDNNLREIQNVILENPEVGDVIVKGRGLRKMRVALPGRGKSGGARMIYYRWASASLCYFVFAYPKNVMDDLSDRQLNTLAELMQKEIENG